MAIYNIPHGILLIWNIDGIVCVFQFNNVLHNSCRATDEYLRKRTPFNVL